MIIDEVASRVLRAGYESLYGYMANHSEWVTDIWFDSRQLHVSAVIFQELEDAAGTFLDIIVEIHTNDGQLVERHQCSLYRNGRFVFISLAANI